MSEKKKVNRSHHDFPKYEEEFTALQNNLREELNGIRPSRGQDGPSGDIYKKFEMAIKALQQKYSYLFDAVEE